MGTYVNDISDSTAVKKSVDIEGLPYADIDVFDISTINIHTRTCNTIVYNNFACYKTKKLKKKPS